MVAVNREIDELMSTQCEDGGDYEIKSAVTYATKDIFSIYASASYYCGGPYPTNDANLSMTFDLKTGRAVSFKDLFKDYEADKERSCGQFFPSRWRGPRVWPPHRGRP